MGWISVADRLPMVTAGYIIAVDDGKGNKWSILGTYSLEMKTWFGEFGEIKNKVTHWTPLPKPPGQTTNGDQIRTMTDKELSYFLCDFRTGSAGEHHCAGCKAEEYCRTGHNGMIDWLKQPAKED